MHFHPGERASVRDFCDDSIFKPLFLTSLKEMKEKKMKVWQIQTSKHEVGCSFCVAVGFHNPGVWKHYEQKPSSCSALRFSGGR